MKQFITSLVFIFLLIAGATATTTVGQFGREMTIEAITIKVDNVLEKQPRTVAEADAYQALLGTFTSRISENVGGSKPGIVFNNMPHIWASVTSSNHTNPATEADLDYVFNTMYTGQYTFPKPYRTLMLLFVKSVPSRSALMSGKYALGSYGGINWVFPVNAAIHKIAIVLPAAPASVDQAVFAEAIAKYFAIRHGVDHTPTFQDYQIRAIRSSLLSPNGLGCYEPRITKCEITTVGGEKVFKVWLTDLIASRCYRMVEYKDGLDKPWTEHWFTTFPDTGIPTGSAPVTPGKSSSFYNVFLCAEK